MGSLAASLTLPSFVPTWGDVALRIGLTVVAGALLGIDRQAKGHAAGFRTTILVGLAAALAMLAASSMVTLTGKAPDSFVQLDLMRLPLGILTGVGFIGGGAILKKDELVRGVTTAATLWMITVIGLCMGAGLLGLGCSGTVAAVFALAVLKQLDVRLPRKHHGRLVLRADRQFSLDRFRSDLASSRFSVAFMGEERSGETRLLTFEVTWTLPEKCGHDMRLISRLEGAYDLVSFAVTSGVH